MNTNAIHISEWVATLDVRKPFYLAIINQEGVLTFTNSGFYTRFFSTHGAMADHSFFDLIHRDDQPLFKDRLMASTLAEVPVTAQTRIRNGSWRWVKWEVSCIKSNGQPEKFLCLGYDLADEIQLIKKERIVDGIQSMVEDMNGDILFSAFMDHSPFFSWIVDKEDNLVYANKSLLEYFRVDESAYGKKLADIIPGPLAGMIREKHLGLQGKKEDRSVVKFRLDDGEEHIYQVVVFPIHGASPDSLVGGGALDITESYRARQEEKKVSERLREMESLLAKQKLKEQKGIAEAIIKAQEDERTRIGHELHDNINQILASGQLYLNVLTKEIEDFQEIKEKTLEIMQLAIEEVRVLSKGLVLPDLKKGGLVASIDDLVLDLRVGDLFEVEFSHSPTGQLEQMSQSKKITLFRILQEQTKNIIKYSEAKQVKIALHLDIDRVRLEIRDDGQGFDPANIRKGLGLSNIFERSRLYDGNAILSTAPGKGCSIIVNIPFGCHPALR